jgi:hypothetical protein
VLNSDAPDAEFVVAASGLNPWPLPSNDDVMTLVEERKKRGYAVVFERDGWIVLHRTLSHEPALK